MCMSCRSKKKERKEVSFSCMGLYNELVSFDLEVIKRYEETGDVRLLEINKVFREWISSLREKCPDEFEYNLIKEVLKNEYSIG